MITREEIIEKLCAQEKNLRAQNRHEIANAIQSCMPNLPVSDYISDYIKFLNTEAEKLEQRNRKLAATYIRDIAIHLDVQSSPVQKFEDTPEI